MDLDLSGSEKELRERLKVYRPLALEKNSNPGRPKLGVVAREISLLPEHWEWLMNQDGGASATIRLLIRRRAKSNSSNKLKVKMAQERTYKFLAALAGDLAHFEDAIRFLYRQSKKDFLAQTLSWPNDVLKHALHLAHDAFSKPNPGIRFPLI